jgi:hypothetical protein
MCAEDDWRLDDGLFIKEDFFNMVVALFEQDPEDLWCVETLDWWNKYVPQSISTTFVTLFDTE